MNISEGAKECNENGSGEVIGEIDGKSGGARLELTWGRKSLALAAGMSYIIDVLTATEFVFAEM